MHKIYLTPLMIIGAVIVAGLVILLVRVMYTYLRAVIFRTRAHGPAPFTTPNGGGSFGGWVVAFLWAFREISREEQYHYMRETERIKPVQEMEPEPELHADAHVDATLPRRVPLMAEKAVPQAPVRGWDGAVMNEDRSLYWTGKRWASTDRFAPASAERNEDGSQWFDGEEWRWSPGEFPPRKNWEPSRVEWEKGRRDLQKESQPSWIDRKKAKPRWPERPHWEPSERSDVRPDNSSQS